MTAKEHGMEHLTQELQSLRSIHRMNDAIEPTLGGYEPEQHRPSPSSELESEAPAMVMHRWEGLRQQHSGSEAMQAHNRLMQKRIRFLLAKWKNFLANQEQRRNLILAWASLSTTPISMKHIPIYNWRPDVCLFRCSSEIARRQNIDDQRHADVRYSSVTTVGALLARRNPSKPPSTVARSPRQILKDVPSLHSSEVSRAVPVGIGRSERSIWHARPVL